MRTWFEEETVNSHFSSMLPFISSSSTLPFDAFSSSSTSTVHFDNLSEEEVIDCRRCKSSMAISFLYCTQCGYRLKKKISKVNPSSSSERVLRASLVKDLRTSYSQDNTTTNHSNTINKTKPNKTQKEKPRMKPIDPTTILKEDLPPSVAKALLTPLPPPRHSGNQVMKQIHTLSSLEVNNLEVVERGYRFLKNEDKLKFKKTSDDRFPATKPSEDTSHLRQNFEYMADVIPIHQQYEYLQHRSTLFSSSSYEVRGSSSSPQLTERGDDGDNLKDEEKEVEDNGGQKAWLWGQSILSEQKSIDEWSEELHQQPHTTSIKSLETLHPQTAPTTSASLLASSTILFWGNLNATQPPPSEDNEVVPRSTSVMEETDGTKDESLEELEEEEAEFQLLPDIDWMTISPSQLKQRNHYKYVTNLHVGKLFMDCHRIMKSLIPTLAIDYRRHPRLLSESEKEEDRAIITTLLDTITRSKEVLYEAKEVIPRQVEKELQRFEVSSKRQRFQITADVASAFAKMSDIEAFYRHRYEQERKRIEEATPDYIVQNKNSVLFQKILEDNEELKSIQSKATEELRMIGEKVTHVIELESSIINALQ